MPIQDDLCIHTGKNPWQNQNPEWETTEWNFIYDDNGQLIKCTESRGKFDKGTYTYEYDEAGNRTFAKKEKLYSYLESWQIRYIGDKEVSFGHGGKHLEGTGLSANEANQAIAKDVVTKNPGTGQFYKRQLDVNGVTIEYTSYGVKDGLINVGTYYPVQ